MMPVTQIKVGMVIVYDNDLYVVVTRQHVAPGNWRAMVQTKLKNLKTGSQIEKRFNADEKIDRAILDQHEMEFLYAEGDMYHFMNSANYEQITLNAEILGDYAKYLQPNGKVTVVFYEEKAISIEIPQTMVFKVVEADPSVKRATASAQFKNAILENGMTIRVPAFVEAGDSIKVDTETGEYLERG